jgi:hypothetical protein
MLRKLQPHEILFQDDNCIATIYPNTFIQGEMVDDNQAKRYNDRLKAQKELEASQKAFGRPFSATGGCFVSSVRDNAGRRIGFVWQASSGGGEPEVKEISVFTAEDFLFRG